MNKKLLLVLSILVLVFALAACGGGGDEGGAPEGGASNPIGDVANGEELYNQVTIGSASAPGCVTCHSLEADVVVVGPSHAGVAIRAETYVEGQSAEDYMRESLNNPDAHIVDGYTAGVMYQNYGEELKASEVNDLVAYLLTLK